MINESIILKVEFESKEMQAKWFYLLLQSIALRTLSPWWTHKHIMLQTQRITKC